MIITRIENKIKQEITFIIPIKYNKENTDLIYNEVKNSIINEAWEKIIIDFKETEEIDLEAIKSLWEMKNISNAKQKSLEFINMSGRVAVAFKFLGFEEKFNINIEVDKNIIDEVVILGEYEEPLYENIEITSDICFEDKVLRLDSISSFINEINTVFKFEIKEWSVIPDFDRNKLIFLIEVNSIQNIEKAEEHLLHLFLTKYDIRSSIYVLENGSFEEYYNNKLALGIPAGIIKTPKVIKNPYTKQYFLGKIDERY